MGVIRVMLGTRRRFRIQIIFNGNLGKIQNAEGRKGLEAKYQGDATEEKLSDVLSKRG